MKRSLNALSPLKMHPLSTEGAFVSSIRYYSKAESDELLLLDYRVRSKGDDLRMQRFCHPHREVAIIILGIG